MRNKIMGWYDVAANASSDMTNFSLNRSGWTATTTLGFSATDPIAAFLQLVRSTRRQQIFRQGWGWDFYLADELNGCTSDYTAIQDMGTNAHAANRKRQDHDDPQHDEL